MCNNLITLSNITGNDSPYFAYNILNRNESRSMHRHDFYQILYVKHGSILHRHGENSIRLEKGDIFIAPPDFEHFVIFDETNSNVLALYFQEQLYPVSPSTNQTIRSFLNALKLSNHNTQSSATRLKVHLSERQQHTYEELMPCLLREMKCDYDKSSASKSIVDAMLLLVVQAYSSYTFGYKRLKKISESKALIQKILEYINQNYNQDLTVSQITKTFAISRSSFYASFTAIAGTTFKQYLSNLRIEQAKRLFAVPTLTCNDIAQLAGYKEFSTFYRNFIAQTGVSPAQYRKSIIQTTD